MSFGAVCVVILSVFPEADALYKKGDFDRACPLYEKRTPKNAGAWLDIGLCLYKQSLAGGAQQVAEVGW